MHALQTPKLILWQTVMQHYAAIHQGLYCFLRLKQPSGTEIPDNLETSTCDPLKYKKGNHILIALICMAKSIRIQRVKNLSIGNKYQNLNELAQMVKFLLLCQPRVTVT